MENFFKIVLCTIICYLICNVFVVKAKSESSPTEYFINNSSNESCSSEEIRNFFDNDSYIEKDIENSFYFENFKLESTYNSYGTCTLVSLAHLLVYYDTFYNNYIVPNTINYTDRFGNINSIVTIKNGLFSDTIDFRYSEAMLGPTKEFHDYLFDLALRHNLIELIPECDSEGNYIYIGSNKKYTTGGISDSTMNLIFEKYCIENNVDTSLLNFHNEFYLTGIKMLNLLDNNIPLQVSIKDYKYFYNDNGHPKGRKFENSEHSIVVYGYIETNNGIYLKAHFGYADDIVYYVDINSVVAYSYYLFNFEDNHVCSSNYIYQNPENEEFIVYNCPCKDIDYYYDHNLITLSSGEKIHNFIYKANNGYFANFTHEYIYEYYEYDKHIERCIYNQYCEEQNNINHDFINPENNEAYGNSLSDGHYYYCNLCGLIKFFDHTQLLNSISNTHHKINCSYCNFECFNEHNSLYEGNTDDHYRYCIECNSTFDEEHNLTYCEFNDQFHMNTCSCGYTEYINHSYNNEYVCSYCGYQHLDHYYYDYDYLNASFHSKKCLCGFQTTERHFFKDYLDGSKCVSCGFITNGNVLLKVEHDNEILNVDVYCISTYKLKKEDELIENN